MYVSNQVELNYITDYVLWRWPTVVRIDRLLGLEAEIEWNNIGGFISPRDNMFSFRFFPFYGPIISSYIVFRCV